MYHFRSPSYTPFPSSSWYFISQPRPPAQTPYRISILGLTLHKLISVQVLTLTVSSPSSSSYSLGHFHLCPHTPHLISILIFIIHISSSFSSSFPSISSLSWYSYCMSSPRPHTPYLSSILVLAICLSFLLAIASILSCGVAWRSQEKMQDLPILLAVQPPRPTVRE